MARRQQTQTNIGTGQQLQSIARATESPTTVRSDGKGERFLKELSVAKEGFSALLGYSQQNRKQAVDSVIANEASQQEEISRLIELEKMEQSIIHARIAEVSAKRTADNRIITAQEKAISDAAKAKAAQEKLAKDLKKETDDKELLLTNKKFATFSAHAMASGLTHAEKVAQGAQLGEVVSGRINNAVALEIQSEINLAVNGMIDEANANGSPLSSVDISNLTTNLLNKGYKESGINPIELDIETTNSAISVKGDLQKVGSGYRVKGAISYINENKDLKDESIGISAYKVLVGDGSSESKEEVISRITGAFKIIEDHFPGNQDRADEKYKLLETITKNTLIPAALKNDIITMFGSIGDDESAVLNASRYASVLEQESVKQANLTTSMTTMLWEVGEGITSETFDPNDKAQVEDLRATIDAMSSGNVELKNLMNEKVDVLFYKNNVKKGNEAIKLNRALNSYSAGGGMSGNSKTITNEAFAKAKTKTLLVDDPKGKGEIVVAMLSNPNVSSILSDETMEFGGSLSLENRADFDAGADLNEYIEGHVNSVKAYDKQNPNPGLDERMPGIRSGNAIGEFYKQSENLAAIKRAMLMTNGDRDKAYKMIQDEKANKDNVDGFSDVQKDNANAAIRNSFTKEYKTRDGEDILGSDLSVSLREKQRVFIVDYVKRFPEATLASVELASARFVTSEANFIDGNDLTNSGFDKASWENNFGSMSKSITTAAILILNEKHGDANFDNINTFNEMKEIKANLESKNYTSFKVQSFNDNGIIGQHLVGVLEDGTSEIVHDKPLNGNGLRIITQAKSKWRAVIDEKGKLDRLTSENNAIKDSGSAQFYKDWKQSELDKEKRLHLFGNMDELAERKIKIEKAMRNGDDFVAHHQTLLRFMSIAKQDGTTKEIQVISLMTMIEQYSNLIKEETNGSGDKDVISNLMKGRKKTEKDLVVMHGLIDASWDRQKAKREADAKLAEQLKNDTTVRRMGKGG
jgi:hypothetical protein